ncbi:endonuclease/exonuclease/phosphatase family protein [Vreelandella populi]|uniref:Endonuclease/exonuclease/phosphatase n=1 Tax=Vreelandella populi TaxID=2498858 RepID=A0A433LC11_9GAMM|nr:endonuclease/exonuclease/phosphatase family protein [Halomonas populi]RUR46224.1 endonuclease/exonuclease/phosphatase [Halomonas populi]
MNYIKRAKQLLRSALLLCLVLSWPALADIRIGSWNIQNFGWGEQKSIAAVTQVASQFDILAIQELMNAEALDALEAMLEESTGEEWSSMHSHLMGSSSRYQEMYAFLWRDSTVSYEDGAVVYIDDRNAFAREPYSARFKSLESGTDFVLATVHITYGKSISDRTPEIHALRSYWDWLEEVYPESVSRRMLVGDFNMRPSHEAWAELFEVAQPLITTGATTLSSNDRQYANLYDNIIVPLGHDLPISEVGIFTFPELLSEKGEYWSHEDARRHVSDHTPVFATFGDTPTYGSTDLAVKIPAQPVEQEPSSSEDCIDLNKASRDELVGIIHIGEIRVDDLIVQRPWTSVNQLTRINGIGPARLRDINNQNFICDL